MASTGITWPKLLGITLACTSLGLVMSLVPDWWSMRVVAKGSLGAYFWFFCLASAVLLILSYPLYHARDWARRAVLVLGGCFTIVVLVAFVRNAILEAHLPNPPFDRPEIRGLRATGAIGQIGLAICIIAPQLFVLRALCHADVVATFRNAKSRKGD